MQCLNDTDFAAEFEELSNYDFKGHAGLSALYDGMGSNGDTKEFRVFTEIRKERAFGMRDMDKIKEFSELLMEYGNLVVGQFEI